MNAAVLVVAVNVIGATDITAEQQPPPIHGVTGTIATETTIQEEHEGARGILVKAKRLFRLNRRGAVDNGDAAGEEILAGLKRGTPVFVHTATAAENLTAEETDRLGTEGLKLMEGVITSVSRTDRTISIRLADGTRQTLRLSDEAAAGVEKDIDRAGDGTARVIVFVKDESGQRVVHYFKRVS